MRHYASSMPASPRQGIRRMSDFVISRQYGELIEGYQSSQVALSRALQAQSTGIQNQAEVLLHLHERDQWIEVMRRCLVFVQ